MLLKQVLAVPLLFSTVFALDNGLALTPPMGWMSWIGFGCNTDCENDPSRCLSEDLIKRIADRMVSDGYLKAGYNYIIIDDCWLEMERSPDGKLVPSRDRFKSGIKKLADYVHSKGLKFGIYEDWGNKTCQGYPGVLGHEEVDAQTFAEWGVDYLKLDGCYSDIDTMDQGYPAFGQMLNKTGRPMVYSCSWPAYQEDSDIQVNYSGIAEACNLWRNWVDIDKSWESILSIMDWFGENQDRLLQYSGPGHFNDPDQLVVGFDEVSFGQAEAQMWIWAMLAAPLLMGADLDLISPDHKELLLNKEIIQVNQDLEGKPGRRISHNEKMDVWKRTTSKTTYTAFVPRVIELEGEIHFNLNDINLAPGTYDVQDVMNKDFETVMHADSVLSFTFDAIPGVKVFKFTKRVPKKNNMANNVNVE